MWSYDFVEGRTHDGRKFRILSIIDKARRECLALPMARRLRSEDDGFAALYEEEAAEADTRLCSCATTTSASLPPAISWPVLPRERFGFSTTPFRISIALSPAKT